MVPAVKNVTPGDEYVLSLVFDNGEEGTLDMKPFLDFGIFRRLRDYGFFQCVRVSFDTIAWGDEIDLDPEFVYEKCERVRESEKVAV